MSAQLDIFEINDISILREEFKKTKETSDKTREVSENVRKGIFARLTVLEKNMLNKFLEQQQKIDYLEEAIKAK